MSDDDGEEGGVPKGVASGVTENEIDVVDDAQAEVSVKEMTTEEQGGAVGDEVSTTGLLSQARSGRSRLSESLTFPA